MKKVIILNGSGGKGKDTFFKMVSKIIPSLHYSIVATPKELCEMVGYDDRVKSEKNRQFVHQMKILLEWYNDTPFNDIASYIKDFLAGYYDDKELLFIDMREERDIARAVKIFDAIPILVRNTNVQDVTSNPADAGVENYKHYEYIINNNGTFEDLYNEAIRFIDWLKCQ